MGGRPNRHGQSRERRGDQDPREPRSEVPDTPFAEDYSLSERVERGSKVWSNFIPPLPTRGDRTGVFEQTRSRRRTLWGGAIPQAKPAEIAEAVRRCLILDPQRRGPRASTSSSSRGFICSTKRPGRALLVAVLAAVRIREW